MESLHINDVIVLLRLQEMRTGFGNVKLKRSVVASRNA
jgi:hypothetical protein